VTLNIRKLSLKNLAGLISDKLKEYGLEAVLSGGACVSIYSVNRYRSYDLDFVSPSVDLMGRKIISAMAEIGFTLTPNNYFANKKCKYFIEFICSPLSVGSEKVKHIRKMRTKYGMLSIISPTDCVKDRLAAYFHWNDRQSLEQALMVARAQKIDLKELKRWAKAENSLEKYSDFLKELNK
jgi:hypothetical protein